jgi:hypothetical protein
MLAFANNGPPIDAWLLIYTKKGLQQ